MKNEISEHLTKKFGHKYYARPSFRSSGDSYHCVVGNMAEGHTPSTRIIRSLDDEPTLAGISLTAGGRDIGELHPATWLFEK